MGLRLKSGNSWWQLQDYGPRYGRLLLAVSGRLDPGFLGPLNVRFG